MPMPTLPAPSTNKATVVPVATLKSEEAEAPPEKTSKSEAGVVVPIPTLPPIKVEVPQTPKKVAGVVVPMPTYPNGFKISEPAVVVKVVVAFPEIVFELMVKVPPKVPVAA